jgi:hypothetical protein
MIEIISNEGIMRGLMENTPLIIMGEMRNKFLGSQIGENVSIPRIICRYGKKIII